MLFVIVLPYIAATFHSSSLMLIKYSTVLVQINMAEMALEIDKKRKANRVAKNKVATYAQTMGAMEISFFSTSGGPAGPMDISNLKSGSGVYTFTETSK